MLVAERTSTLIDADLTRLGAACARLARSHRDTLMAGRTLLQQALPITFGLKAASWLTGVQAAHVELRHARAGLAAQLGGATGTLASLGSQGPAVVAAFARQLRLPEPLLPWHGARQRVAVLAGAVLGVVAGSAAKIASDVILLAQTEVHEAHEHDAGGSSALPHKRNPAASVAVVAAARRAHAVLPVLFSALVAETSGRRGPGTLNGSRSPSCWRLRVERPAGRRTWSTAWKWRRAPWRRTSAAWAAWAAPCSRKGWSLAVTAITGDRDAGPRRS